FREIGIVTHEIEHCSLSAAPGAEGTFVALTVTMNTMHTPIQSSFLKRIVLPVLLALTVACGSKKDDKPGVRADLPKSSVPAEMVGKYWHAGSFSMTQFSNYDGSYAGQAFEIATGYKFS